MPGACRSCPRAHKLLWLHAQTGQVIFFLWSRHVLIIPAVYISVLNGALWDMGQVHRGICPIGIMNVISVSVMSPAKHTPDLVTLAMSWCCQSWCLLCGCVCEDLSSSGDNCGCQHVDCTPLLIATANSWSNQVTLYLVLQSQENTSMVDCVTVSLHSPGAIRSHCTAATTSHGSPKETLPW